MPQLLGSAPADPEAAEMVLGLLAITGSTLAKLDYCYYYHCWMHNVELVLMHPFFELQVVSSISFQGRLAQPMHGKYE